MKKAKHLSIYDAIFAEGDRVLRGNDPRIWVVTALEGDRLRLEWIVKKPVPHTLVITWARPAELRHAGES